MTKLSRDHQQLLDNYTQTVTESSRRQRTARAWRFLDFIGDKKTPSTADAKAYLKNLETKNYAAGTIRETYNILSKFFRINRLEWEFKRGEVPMPREEDQYAPSLAIEEIQLMVEIVRGQKPSETIPPQPRHRVFLCVSTIWGLRRAEMAVISAEDINLEQRAIYIHTVKKGRARYHVIPEFAVPFLEEWDFSLRMPVDTLSQIFRELREMAGIPDLLFVGWHAIRRACERAAYQAHFVDPELHSYYRYKRGSGPITMRYATSRVVSRHGEVVGPGLWDRELDQQFYERHPFMEFWR